MKSKKYLIFSAIFALIFIIFTILVSFVDVQAIGPNDSTIGFGTVNKLFNDIFSKGKFFKILSDLVCYFALLLAVGFVVLAVVQFVRRKSLKLIDKSIVWLGVIYALLVVVYIFFELVIVNFRPILVDGELKASYPSSHLMLICTILGTAIIEIAYLIRNKKWRISLQIGLGVLIVVGCIGRLLSGMHWFTDILGGVLISVSLIFLYKGLTFRLKAQSRADFYKIENEK